MINRRRNFRPLYQVLASKVQAAINCDKMCNWEMKDQHENDLRMLVDRFLPSGSGFNAGVQLKLDTSNGNRLHFQAAFQHRDEAGGSNGWTTHDIVVTPHLAHGITMKVHGKNKDGINEYIADEFYKALLMRVNPLLEPETLPEEPMKSNIVSTARVATGPLAA